jgi:hypothetical protein
MMSVTASAGEATPIATATTAKQKNRRIVLNMKIFQCSAVDMLIRTAYTRALRGINGPGLPRWSAAHN